MAPELDRLGDFLKSCKGPETVRPSEYYSDWNKTSRLVENASMTGRRGR